MKIAVFPGSFDPITNAHVDIVKRGLGLFDKIVIGLGVNTTKKGYFTHDQRFDILKAVFAAFGDRVEVVRFTGLTVDFCRKVGAKFILRGMRSAGDFEFEKAIAHNNQVLVPELESIFLISRIGLSHLSSTIVREILASQGDVNGLVPPEVIAYISTIEG